MSAYKKRKADTESQSSAKTSQFSKKAKKPMYWPAPVYATGAEKNADSFFRFFVDGACSGNEQKNAALRLAGYGIWLESEKSKWQHSAPLEHPCTNNRAELTAILVLLNFLSASAKEACIESLPVRAAPNNSICICGDNEYSLNICTKWLAGWRRNGFMTAAGKPVENRDIVEQIDVGLQNCAHQGLNIAFQWVRAHENEPPKSELALWKFWNGNRIADELARQGALKKNIVKND